MSFPGWRKASSDGEVGDAGRVRDSDLPRRRGEETRRKRFGQTKAGMGFRRRGRLRDHPTLVPGDETAWQPKASRAPHTGRRTGGPAGLRGLA